MNPPGACCMENLKVYKSQQINTIQAYQYVVCLSCNRRYKVWVRKKVIGEIIGGKLHQ